MATTLANGRIKPQTGDKGSVWFSAIENNIDLDDAHTHDGINSPQLTASAFTKEFYTVADADFTQQADGFYTAPIDTGILLDPNESVIRFYLNSTGSAIYPEWKRLSGTSVEVTLADLPGNLTVVDDLRMVRF